MLEDPRKTMLAAAVIFYSATPAPARFMFGLDGRWIDQVSCAPVPPPRDTRAITPIAEGLLMLAIEAGFVSEPDLQIVRPTYRPLLTEALRREHAAFAGWLDGRLGG